MKPLLIPPPCGNTKPPDAMWQCSRPKLLGLFVGVVALRRECPLRTMSPKNKGGYTQGEEKGTLVHD